jgi:hypothetical protein
MPDIPDDAEQLVPVRRGQVRLVVWQGNREEHFRQNLKRLQQRTGLPLGRA